MTISNIKEGALMEGITIQVVSEEEQAAAMEIAGETKLVASFCDCETEGDFLCYPSDGACSCGMYKHHVHGSCGHIIQVG